MTAAKDAIIYLLWMSYIGAGYVKRTSVVKSIEGAELRQWLFLGLILIGDIPR